MAVMVLIVWKHAARVSAARRAMIVREIARAVCVLRALPHQIVNKVKNQDIWFTSQLVYTI
jgi:hypothetical protein